MKKTSFFFIALFLTHAKDSASQSKIETSVDIYCKSMTYAFADTYKFLGRKPNNGGRFENLISNTKKICYETPTPSPMRRRDMNADQVQILNCLGFAQGAYLAHTIGEPTPSYTKMTEEREFHLQSCKKNSKKFKDDIFRMGPAYAMRQNY